MARPIHWIVALALITASGGALAATRTPARTPNHRPGATSPASRTQPTIRHSARRPPRSKAPRPTLALQIGHSGLIWSVAFCRGGGQIITGGTDNTTRLWDAGSGQLIATFPGRWFALSPDSRTLATAGTDNAVRLWDRASGRLTATLEGAAVPIAFAPDGRRLATNVRDHSGRIWDAVTGQVRVTLQGRYVLSRLVFSPDGKTLATAGGRLENGKVVQAGEILLWGAATGQLRRTLRGHQNRVWALTFSPDGKTLATGSGDMGEPGEARLWDAQSGELKGTLPGHTGRVQGLAFSPDGKTLATGSWDALSRITNKAPGEVRLWDVATAQLKRALPGHENEVHALAFSPDGQLLATGGRGAAVQLWNAQTGQLKAGLEGHRSFVTALAFSPDGRMIATASADHAVRLWDPRTGEQKRILTGHSGDVRTFAFSPDGKTLAAGHFDGPARLWDTRSGQLRATLRGHRSIDFCQLVFSPDGDTLATGGAGSDHTARLWDAGSGQLKAVLQGHTQDCQSLAFSRDGKAVATGSGDRTVRLWDAASGQSTAVLEGHVSAVRMLAFSPDGRTLAAGTLRTRLGSRSPEGKITWRSLDPTMSLWDAQSRQLTATLTPTGAVSAMPAFAPDGRTLAVSDDDGSVKVWDAVGGQLKTTLRGHTSTVRAIAIAPDGKTLATGSGDRTARLWDAVTGQLQAALPRYATEVTRLAFSPDGKTLAAGDRTKVALWHVGSKERIGLKLLEQLAPFPRQIAYPATTAGAALLLHDPRDGRVLATMLPMPEVAEEAARARPIEVGAKPIAVGAKAVPPAGGEWFVATPEGYFDCTANAARSIRWNLNGVLYPAERYLRRFRRPDLVRRALRGERITAPKMSAQDIPPAVRFLGLENGDAAPGDPMTVTLEARAVRDVREVELLVNGRPLPPEVARPITVGAKPITVGAKPILVGAKAGDPHHRLATTYTFRVPLPLGAEEIHLRAVAYDAADLGSDPVEVVLQRVGARPVAGNLYVLSVGVSRYRNADNRGFRNLQFPAIDARAIGARFQREGTPLYERVQIRTLTDEQATAAKVREGLEWLKASVRPGQIDTVVIFLSGHGISDVSGRYHFATHDLALKNVAGTSLSGRELREALGGKLRAKAVFLFVDTCHAGGLGGRNDDLALEVGEGVFLLASSGAKEYSYESESWGHGAFTLALLRSLEKRELASNGVLHFNALTYAVPEEVARLMAEVGRNESEQEPCVPLASRRLRVPIAMAAR